MTGSGFEHINCYLIAKPDLIKFLSGSVALRLQYPVSHRAVDVLAPAKTHASAHMSLCLFRTRGPGIRSDPFELSADNTVSGPNGTNVLF